MRVIETSFDGYRFRSRLEARWAVFYKTLKITYEYEKEGYNLNGIYYLPDFWLPAQDCFVEIKGVEPSFEEEERALRLLVATKKMVYVFFGNIPLVEDIPFSTSALACLDEFTLDFYYWWCECPVCGAFGICKYGLVHFLPCKHVTKLFQAYHTEKLRAAYRSARSARFEHKK